MNLDERFRAFLKREHGKPISWWGVVACFAIAYPIARNGAPYNPDAGQPSRAQEVAQRDTIERAVNRCQAAIKGKWRGAVPTAGMAETILESDRVIVKQPFKIGTVQDDGICDVSNEGRVSVAR